MNARRIISLIVVILAITLANVCHAEETGIHPDLQAALDAANQAGKILLVDFSGSWCPWCVKMDETFADASIKDIVSQRYYYFKLDVGQFDQHTGCTDQYKVEGIPYIIAFNRDGSIKAQSDGYKDVPTFKTFLEKTAGVPVSTLPIHPDLKAALKSANDAGKILLVDFYGSWCPWCVKMDDTFADSSVKAIVDKQFYYYKLDVGQFDKHTECIEKYGVKGIPYIIAFNADGSVKSTSDGYDEPKDFIDFLNDVTHKGFTWLTLDEQGTPDPIRAAIETAKAERLRLVAFFYDKDDSGSTSFEKILDDVDTEGVAERYAVVEIELASHKSLGGQYGCSTAPFLIIFKKDGVATFFTEPVTADKLKTALKDSLAK